MPGREYTLVAITCERYVERDSADSRDGGSFTTNRDPFEIDVPGYDLEEVAENESSTGGY